MQAAIRVLVTEGEETRMWAKVLEGGRLAEMINTGYTINEPTAHQTLKSALVKP